MNFIIAGFVFLHMFLIFLFTQKVYSGNKIFTASLITLILPCLLLVFFGKDTQLVHLNAGLISFYYCILLHVIKKEYKKINNYFIAKGRISELYKNKDYTFTMWTEEGTWWDTDLSSKPSWLDTTLTFILVTLPILVFAFLNFLLSLLGSSRIFASFL